MKMQKILPVTSQYISTIKFSKSVEVDCAETEKSIESRNSKKKEKIVITSAALFILAGITFSCLTKKKPPSAPPNLPKTKAISNRYFGSYYYSENTQEKLLQKCNELLKEFENNEKIISKEIQETEILIDEINKLLKEIQDLKELKKVVEETEEMKGNSKMGINLTQTQQRVLNFAQKTGKQKSGVRKIIVKKMLSKNENLKQYISDNERAVNAALGRLDKMDPKEQRAIVFALIKAGLKGRIVGVRDAVNTRTARAAYETACTEATTRNLQKVNEDLGTKIKEIQELTKELEQRRNAIQEEIASIRDAVKAKADLTASIETLEQENQRILSQLNHLNREKELLAKERTHLQSEAKNMNEKLEESAESIAKAEVKTTRENLQKTQQENVKLKNQEESAAGEKTRVKREKKSQGQTLQELKTEHKITGVEELYEANAGLAKKQTDLTVTADEGNALIATAKERNNAIKREINETVSELRDVNVLIEALVPKK